MQFIVRNYTKHQVYIINEHAKFSKKFEFKEVTIEEVAVKIRQLNPSKASPVDCIPAKILKENSDVFSVAIRNLFNSGLSKGTFSKELKAGDISPLFKKEDAFSKKNYRTTDLLQFCHQYQKLRKVDARSNAAFCPIFLVSTPLWISRGLWYTACTSTFS